MKLNILKIILFILNVKIILNKKLKNITLNKNNYYPITTHKNNSTNISDHDLELFQEFSKMKKKNSFRTGSKDFSSEFADKQFTTGICLVKFNGYIINLYPLSDRDGGGFFLKYKTDVYDFDICRNIFTYTSRFGLFVERNKDILFAGDADSEKYFNIGIEKNELEKHDENGKNKENTSDNQIYNLNRVKENPIIGKARSFIHKKPKINRENLQILNVTVFLPQGQKCPSNPQFDYIVAYRFICDINSVNPITINANKFNPDSCFNIIEIKTDKVCVQNLVKFKIWFQILNINKSIIAIFICAVGFFLVTCSDLYRHKSFLITIGLSIFFVLKIFLSDMNYAVLVGILIGVVFLLVFLRNNHEILMCISSLLLSIEIGSFVFNNTARNILDNYDITIDMFLFLIYTFSFFAVYIISSFFSENLFFALIFNTSFGSYLFIRGLSIFFGGYPDEQYCYILFKYREFKQYDKSFDRTKNIYAIAFVALWGVSILIQYYIIVPVMHKMNQIELDRKANLKFLNKLGDGYIHVDEGLDVQEDLLDENEKQQKKKKEKIVNGKALLKKNFDDEFKKKKESSKVDFSKEDLNEEKEVIKEEKNEKDNIETSEFIPIFKVDVNKSKYDKEFEREETKVKNVNLKSDSKTLDNSNNNFGIRKTVNEDGLINDKREIRSHKDTKSKFDE